MKRVSVLLATTALLLNLSTIIPAHAGALAAKGKVTATGACSYDGSSGAPAGATILLAGYKATVAFPPPCAVPDIDYGIGPISGLTFKDPTTTPSPGSDGYYAPTNTFYCGVFGVGNNLVIEGYDFSLHGGVKLNTGACTNLTIQNNKFAVGTNCANIFMDVGPGPISFLNNDVDGGGKAANDACIALGASNADTIRSFNSGLHIFKYNRIHDVDQHFITFDTDSMNTPGEIQVEFNGFEGCGFEQGVHCNAAQFGHYVGPGLFQNNLYYDPQPTIASETLAVTYNGTTTFHVTAGTGGVDFRAGVLVTGSCITGTATVLSVGGVDNRDVLTNKTATCSTSGTVASPNMYPVGIIIPTHWISDAGAVLGDVNFKANYYAGPGPITGTTYPIYCDGTVGSFTANTNYYDPRNTSGGLFNLGGSCAAPHTGSGNVRTDTGATIPVP